MTKVRAMTNQTKSKVTVTIRVRRGSVYFHVTSQALNVNDDYDSLKA
jgi:hypothetical protein